MALLHMKRCSASLFIRQVWIKKKMRHHYNLLEWLKPSELTMASAGKNAEQLKLPCITGRNIKWYSSCEKTGGSFS